MHTLLAVARLIHRAIRKFGPASAFTVLARYTMPCAWLICAMCVCAGGYDLMRGRRLDALLWMVMMVLSYTAFWMKTGSLAGTQLSAAFAVAAVVVDLWVLSRSLRERFWGRS
jgi:hypothetical protein